VQFKRRPKLQSGPYVPPSHIKIKQRSKFCGRKACPGVTGEDPNRCLLWEKTTGCRPSSQLELRKIGRAGAMVKISIFKAASLKDEERDYSGEKGPPATEGFKADTHC